MHLPQAVPTTTDEGTAVGGAPVALRDLTEDLIQQSEAARQQGDYRTGSALAQEAADLAAAIEDDGLQGLALRVLAVHLVRLGDHEQAVRATALAAQLLHGAGDEKAACKAQTVQALAYTKLGLHDEALASLSSILDIAERLDDRELQFWIYNRIGGVHGSLGDYRQGKAFLRRALGLARTDLDDESVFCILNNLSDNAVGLVKQLRGDGEAAAAEEALAEGLEYARDALVLARAAQHAYRESMCLGNHGTLLTLAGKYAEATAMLRRSGELGAAHGYRALELEAMQGIAAVYLVVGRVDEAIATLDTVLAMAAEPNQKTTIVAVHQQLSEAYEKRGDTASALRHYRTYHEAERTMYSAMAETRARLLTNRFELDNARLEAERARLEAELHRVRREELERERLTWRTEAEESARRAREDQLTGLWNRRHQDEELSRLARAATTSNRPLCVAIGDVDRFKGINDQFGHPVGDEVLKRLADILRVGSRPGDLVTRMGGEEFCLAFADTELSVARGICERLRAAVEAYDWAGLRAGLRVTISFGVALLAPGSDALQVLDAADVQLYRAKHHGRNRVEPVMPLRLRLG
ncbi:tetratricopeptide repeat-containing diguanylate cyclase [Actinomycetes bacterium KLBMP 9797]